MRKGIAAAELEREKINSNFEQMSSDFVLGTISVCVSPRKCPLYLFLSLISALWSLYAAGLIRIYQFQYGTTTTPRFTEQILQRHVST